MFDGSPLTEELFDLFTVKGRGQRTICKQKAQTFADSVVSQISFCYSWWLSFSAWDGGGSGADSATQSST